MVAFEIVTIVVCVGSAVIASVVFVRGLKLYDEIGRLGSLAMTHGEEPNAATREQVREEVREMLDALAEVDSPVGRGARQRNPAKSH